MNYKEMDNVVQATIVNLYTLSKDIKEIRISNFGDKNKNHLYLLSVANIASTLFNFPVKIKMNRIKLQFLKWKYPNLYKNVQKCDEAFSFSAQTLLEDMQRMFIPHLGNEWDYSDIYEAYYERKKR